ncbi:hypothetical protein [Halobacteriaceae bacterium SHR40]|uniref:hypothetical protein n=1 Tax=Halovenus amylolytica TaxID=2500550 RepID=UPI000FE308B1
MTGTTAMLALAGCSDSDDNSREPDSTTNDDVADDDSTDDDSETLSDEEQQAIDVVRQHYEASQSVEEFSDLEEEYIPAINEILYSNSPLQGFYQSFTVGDVSSVRFTVHDDIEMSITGTDLTEEEIRDEFAFADSLSEVSIVDVANENYKIKTILSNEATVYTRDNPPEEVSDAKSSQKRLVTMEDGEWVLVM